MTNIIELKTARYKGVEFLFTEASTTGGNRLIKFRFPGSDKQAIERQGQVPKSFTLNAIIPYDDYFQKRDQLLNVLDDGVAGVLTHPTFGDIENIINGQYTLVEIISELGRAKVTIPFEVNDSVGIPQQSGDLASQVDARVTEVNTQAQNDLGADYSVDINLSGNFSDAVENVDNVATFFTQATQIAEPITDKISDFRTKINTFSSQVGSLIQAPSQLASSISGLFEDLNLLYESPETLFGAFQLLAGFGKNDPVINQYTVARIQRAQNRNLLRANMRTQALSYAYINSAERTYQTTEDLETAITALENQYLDLRENQLVSNEAMELIDRARVQTYKTLDTVRVNTKSIVTIETPRRPLSVLVYSLYGSTELTETIAELNNVKRNAFVEGELKVLAG